MKLFHRQSLQVTNLAMARLEKVFGSRPEVSLPTEPAQILINPPKQAIAPIAKFVIVAVSVVGLLVWLNRPSPTTVPVVTNNGIAIPGTSKSPTVTDGSGDLGSANQIVVDVKGDVLTPGLVTLNVGDRVADAITAAGGLTPSANVTSLNLAERLSDGQMIFIGNAQSSDVASDPRININQASETDLDALPGVGPVMAGRIVAWRETNQRFHSVDELQEVPGIGPKVFANLKPLVRI
jgi:competence protein ComEA